MRGDLVWRAWHLVTRSAVFRVAGVALGMRGTYGAGLALVTRLVAAGPS